MSNVLKVDYEDVGGKVEKIGNSIQATSHTTTVATWNLSSYGDLGELNEGFFVIFKAIHASASNLNNGSLALSTAYDSSTHILTITMGGDTSYVHMYASSPWGMTIDIYKIS